MRIRIFKTPVPKLPPLSEWSDPHLEQPGAVPLREALAVAPVSLEMFSLRRTLVIDPRRWVK